MAEPIGSLVVRIGGDATDLLDAFKRAGRATEDLKSKVDSAITGFKALAAALAFREMAHFVASIAEVEDALGKMAERTGIAVETLSELTYAGKLADLSTEQLGTGLKFLAKNMAEAQSGSLEAKQAFVALFGRDWTMKPTEQQLFDIADKFQKMEDGAGKAALAMKLFGKSGTDLIPFLNQGSAGLRANAEEARKLGIVISTEAAKAAQEFNDNLKRLSESSAGLARTLAGPLIKAISDTAAEMVKAKKEGDDFFSVWIRGWRQLTTGSDADKFNADLGHAERNLQLAVNALEAVKKAAEPGSGRIWFGDKTEAIKKFSDAVVVAQAKVDHLRGIQTTLLGPVMPPAKKEEQKEVAPELPDLAKAQQRALFVAKQQAEGEEQLAQERIALQKYVDSTVVEGVAIIEAANQRELDSYIALYEGTQEAQRQAQDAYVKLRGERLTALETSLLSDEEIETRAYEARLEQLQTMSDAELELIGGRQAVEQQMEIDHQSRMLEIRASGLNNLSAFSKASWGAQTKTIIGMIADMTAAAATKNRELFEINKIASTANAIVKGWEAVQSAYAFGSAWGGPVGGAAMAALAAVATAANVMAIQSTSFGSGIAPSAGPTPAPPVTPVQSAGPAGGGQTTVLHLHGETFSRKQLSELFEQMNEGLRDGGRITVAA